MKIKYLPVSLCTLAMLAILLSIPLTGGANAIGDADRDLFQYINEDMQNEFLDVTLPVIQRMGETEIYLGVCAFLCAFGNEKMAETGKLAVAAMMESAPLTYSLKKIVGRPRPLAESEKNSFPSGHTTLAFTMATVVGNEYPRLRIPLYITALGTAFARIYLGRHYPSDVFVGALIGTLAGIHITHCRDRVLGFSF